VQRLPWAEVGGIGDGPFHCRYRYLGGGLYKLLGFAHHFRHVPDFPCKPKTITSQLNGIPPGLLHVIGRTRSKRSTTES